MEENDDYIKELQNEAGDVKAKNIQLNSALQSIGLSNEPNIVEYQLEYQELLENIKHYLSGNILRTDKEGNEYFGKPTKEEPVLNKDGSVKKDNKGRLMIKEVIDDDLIPLNDYGVNSMMQVLSGYLTKGTVLSIYSEERIYEIMSDIGKQLAILIYCNYERMGMTTKVKQSRYIMMVLQICHMVESAYRRSLQGITGKQINTTSIMTQSDILRPQNMQPIRTKRSLLKPGTW